LGTRYGSNRKDSFVTRKSGELQVSPGIVWGLVMDLIAKNPDHFGTDADACPEPVEPGSDLWYTEPVEIGSDNVEHHYKVGDKIRVYSSRRLKDMKCGQIFTISDIDNNGIVYVFDNDLLFFILFEIEPYTEPVDEYDPVEFRVGDVVRTKNGCELVIINIKYFGKQGDAIYSLQGSMDSYFKEELQFISRP